MAGRYAFWRSPDAKPYRGVDGKHSPSAILAKLEEEAEIDATGRITWGFHEHRYRTALQPLSIILDPEGRELNPTDTQAILNSVIEQMIRKGKGPPGKLATQFLTEVDIAAAEFYRRALSPYTLLTHLSVTSFPHKPIRLGDCKLTMKARSDKFPYPPVIASRIAEPQIQGLVRKSNQLHVTTLGRTPFDAAERGFRAINVIRGIWTLCATYQGWQFGGPDLKREPLGVIHSGPLYTLHLPDGRLAGDMAWYEPDGWREMRPFTPAGGWDNLEKDRMELQGNLSKHSFASEVEALLIRYAVALDNSNYSITLINLWSILEKITNTVGAKYDETIRRVLCRFKHRHLMAELLESLRISRNQLVHSATDPHEGDQLVFLLKSFVDPHLVWLIRNDFKAKTPEEYSQYLAMSPDAKELRLQRLRCDRMLRLRSKWEEIDKKQSANLH